VVTAQGIGAAGSAAERRVVEAAPQNKTRTGEKRCGRVSANLIAVVDFATFTADGAIHGTLNGAIHYDGDATSVIPVNGSLFPPARDALAFSGQLTISTVHGDLVTRNAGVFETGPFGKGTEIGNVVDGTGIYAGATGSLYFTTRSDGSGTVFSERVSGTVCLSDRKQAF
jgi:hypothetical protein